MKVEKKQPQGGGQLRQDATDQPPKDRLGPPRYTGNAKATDKDYARLPEDDPESVYNARWMDLDFESGSQTAAFLTEELAGEATAWLRSVGKLQRSRRQSDEQRFRRMVAAFCADLLMNAVEHPGRWGYRSQAAKAFTGTGLSVRMYRDIRGAFVARGFIEGVPGFSEGMENTEQAGRADRVRATARFFEACASSGINSDNVREHFVQSLPRQVLRLKPSSHRDPFGRKVKGSSIPFKRDERARQLENEVRELNEFLDGFELTGGVHRGYCRVFNEGSRGEYGWDKGGRLYSQESDCYQRMKRRHRGLMRLDGEPVLEIDVQASYLTIFYAQHGFEIGPEDPYEIDGLPDRSVAKAWVAMTLGHDRFHTKWPKGVVKRLREKKKIDVLATYPIDRVRSAVIDRHPLLRDWATSELSWADLMYLESNAVVATMLRLKREFAVPCLNVHDSIIVPHSACRTASMVLSREYERSTGARPHLKVSKPSAVAAVA